MTRTTTFPGTSDRLLHEAEFARAHRVLEELMEKLYERNRAGAAHAELVGILRELEAGTADHFRNEEAYMASVDYGGLPAHQRVHRQLLCELTRHVSAYARTEGRVPAKLLAFLRNWLAAHIQDGEHKQRGFAAMSRRSLAAE